MEGRREEAGWHSLVFVTIQENVRLASFTTLRMGGPARFFIRIDSTEDLIEGLRFAKSRELPVFILGGGSNLVVSDEGFDGLVFHMALGSGIAVDRSSEGVRVVVDAGVDWDALVLHLCRQGISGLECLAGIPGLTGGTPVQNVGAYGQEVADAIESVTVLDRTSLQTAELPNAACGFGYRKSIFNSTARDRYIVTRVTFLLAADAKPNLSYGDLAPLRDRSPSALEVYDFVRAVRERKGMLIDQDRPSADSRSAGSFFKNPVIPAEVFKRMELEQTEQIPHWAMPEGRIKLPAAWLIEHAGFRKGFALGGAGISSKHTLALINRTGTATCAELIRLRDTIAAGVLERFHIGLEQEPVFLGE